MPITIHKTVEFEAAHHLSKFPENHKCARNHGHNYVVEVELVGMALTGEDVLADFGSISAVIKNKYDHQDLNDFPEFQDNPTAERLCMVIVDLIDRECLFHVNVNLKAEHWTRIARVRVYETKDCWAEWKP